MLKLNVSLDPEYLLGTEGQSKFKFQISNFGYWDFWASFDIWVLKFGF
jgi:hypothetical protein